MRTYPQRVAENILPLSLAGTLPEAFKEWYFTDNMEDHEIAKEDCELCDQEQLRYHFEIKNRHTDHRLWVGSSCILKFHVQVFDNGALLDAKSSAKKLEELKKMMRLESCIKALRKLAASEKNDIFSNALDFYLKNKYLTPKFAFVIFWRLSSNKIDHSPSFFKVSLKKDKYKKDLAQMPLERVHMIWPALSISQRKLAISYGHSEPGST
ncbi:hypothetical protein H4F51_13240 [Pectobacterium brasiliense]|uniref:hypothetical protein n=1 Tax=Pectobacterium brasiliense TaxID=180957 RepID=UPI0015DE6530|nr:hypothetical protein [Pectobacterium brasiliense]MBA0197657.1 hypothetical protein [Pectobacterium brasiliense]MBN3093528.1 hypothetical protein [Pectobacterium brasiliense]MBN3140879.1 hypothetical protein [Pectobacterium brasiliense]MBW5896632.1 hypothetical protein [Pectobacterium brasiliense]